MANEKFQAAMSTIAGSAFPNFLRTIKHSKIDPEFRKRLWLSGATSLFAEPFRWVEGLRYGIQIRRTKLPENPVFILGHWRSGTTYLHNLMSQDPEMAYVTTYQGIFPNQLLSAKWFFKTLMRANMPKKRAADNVELSPDFPQEEEFALGNMNPYSFYNFWFFPKRTIEYLDKYILLEGLQGEAREKWKKDYQWLMKKSILNLDRPNFVSKNPPHTGRIPILLEMFPNARFVHIYRNPITVFLSTFNFFSKTIEPLRFQRFTHRELKDNILKVYVAMMQKYEQDKLLIPKGNLVEVRYEDFEQDPMPQMEAIYQQLQLGDFESKRTSFQAYVDKQESFQVNKHRVEAEDLERILEHWQPFMDLWGYQVPENLTIIGQQVPQA
ncbi:MAG: sulfotransferase [Chitinophagales bacterium]|nr:sulfotransferase [Chitinophagales bacterium]